LKDCGVPGHFEFSGLLVCLFVLVLSGQWPILWLLIYKPLNVNISWTKYVEKFLRILTNAINSKKIICILAGVLSQNATRILWKIQARPYI
jgi:hypothetical protein